MHKVLVTGGTGFLGRWVLQYLCSENSCNIVAAVRNPNVTLPARVSVIPVTGLDKETDWSAALSDVDTVVHCAACAYMMDEKSVDPLAVYRAINVEGTLALAHQARVAGVRRFVFISSVKVNGESGLFRDSDDPAPQDAYAVSKFEAELGLLTIAKETGMEVVIIRPPLVYGPGVKGNFAAMVRWVRAGVPLPLGAVHNRRSMVALDNLIDFIALCADRNRSPRAANQVFLISDWEDVSTTELLRRVALAYSVKTRLLPVPVGWLRFGARWLGKAAVADRLLGSLVVKSTKAREQLGWRPVVTMDEQLRKMASHDAFH